jgi:hypothetical protein
LTAAALDTPTLGDVQLRQSLGSLKEILERNLRVEEGVELFCFGLLEEFDVLQLAALAAPRQVEFRDMSVGQKSALAPLNDFQELFDAP